MKKWRVKKNDVKSCTCYYFDVIIRGFDINLDEKLYENISVYDVSYKTSTGPKPLRIRFNKIDGFIRIRLGEFGYLIMDCLIKFVIRLNILLSEKSGITDNINHDIGKIRIDSYNSLLIEKILTSPNVTILIKSVVNKDQNNYYYNIFLEKSFCKDKSDTRSF